MTTPGEDGWSESGRGRAQVLFVCTGNICRSPMAEVAFAAISERTLLGSDQRLADVVDAASAGTANWHVGEQMDPRARLALDEAGFTGPGTPAMHVTAELVASSLVVVALDRGHLAELRRLAPTDTELALLLSWAGPAGQLEVPDPFYDTQEGFTSCLELIVRACEALASDLAVRLAGTVPPGPSAG